MTEQIEEGTWGILRFPFALSSCFAYGFFTGDRIDSGHDIST